MKPTKMRNMQTYLATFNKRSKGVSCALSPNLRKKYDSRNIRVATGDGVTVVRGEYKQVQGKVSKVSTIDGRLAIDGIKKEKSKGAKFDVMIHASAVVITDLNTTDQWRMNKLKKGRDIIDDKNPISEDSATVKPTLQTITPKESKTKTPTSKSTSKPEFEPTTVKPTLQTITPKESKTKTPTSKSTSKPESESATVKPTLQTITPKESKTKTPTSKSTSKPESESATKKPTNVENIKGKKSD